MSSPSLPVPPAVLGHALRHGAVALIQPRFHWFRLRGTDTTAFLNRMTTQELTRLADGGHSLPALWLDPRGRVVAAFELARSHTPRVPGAEGTPPPEAHDGVDVFIDARHADAFTTLVDQFVIMDDVTLEPVPEVDRVLLWGPQAAALAAEAYNHHADLSWGTLGGWRVSAAYVLAPRHRVPELMAQWTHHGATVVAPDGETSPPPPAPPAASSPAPSPANLPDTPSTAEAAFDAIRVALGVAWAGQELVPTLHALEVGQLHVSIQDRKGCYPGQEAIEKAISIGRTPRVFCRLTLEAGENAVPQPRRGEALPLPLLDAEGTTRGLLTTIAPYIPTASPVNLPPTERNPETQGESAWAALGVVGRKHAVVGERLRVAVGSSLAAASVPAEARIDPAPKVSAERIAVVREVWDLGGRG